MRKRNLSEWASIAEIIASLGVIISLLFVANSIRQNTAELTADNLHKIYVAFREIEMVVLSDEALREVVFKVETGRRDELNDKEAFLLRQYMTQTLNIWEEAFDKREVGTMDEQSYISWRGAFIPYFGRYMTREDWELIRQWYAQPFQDEVNAAFRESGH